MPTSKEGGMGREGKVREEGNGERRKGGKGSLNNILDFK